MAYPFQSRGRRKGKTAPKRHKNAVTIKDERAYLRREVARPPYVVEGEQFSSEAESKVEARLRSHDDHRRVQVEDSLGTVLAVYYRGKEMSPVDWMPNPAPRRNSITGKKLIAQWRDSYASGGYGYIHGDAVSELLKAIKSKLEKDPVALHRFTISRTPGKGVGVGEIDATAGTITWTNFGARADKVIKFRSPGNWGVFPFDESGSYRDVKPIRVFDTYQKADKWLHEYEGDLRLSGVPRKVNGRARGVGIVATRKALRQWRKTNPADVQHNQASNNPSDYRIIPQKYSRSGNVVITGFQHDKYKGRVERLAEALGGRWVHRQHGYVISPKRAKKFEELYAAGWDGSPVAARLIDPQGEYQSKPRKNPNGSRDDADELYEGFHGKPSTKTTEVHTRLKSRDRLSELGDLVELRVITPAGKKVRLVQDDRGIWHPTGSKQPSYLAANRRTPMLSSSPDRRQLYIEGGIQEADVSAMGLGGDWERDSMLLGILTYATYRTEKGFDKFQLTDYYHKLGEETGDEPVLIYDSINALLSISGGRYEVRNEGIVN